jgi:SAM-dependent methyltransferase
VSIDAVRELVARLNGSVLALAALDLALEAHSSGVALAPNLEAPVNEVLRALGAQDVMRDVDRAALKPLLAEIRMTVLQVAKALPQERRGIGWRHTDEEILQAAGDVSAAFPHALKKMVAPTLDGLVQRLESPGAAFLDVGVGVGMLSIEMARVWPSLRIVGIDPWAPSLAIARHNVADAGLGDRIELRQQAVEDLPDHDAFDLGWLPSVFIPPATIPAAIQRVHAALRPGGWILFAMVNPGTDPLVASLARFRTVLAGGGLSDPAHVQVLLKQAGLLDIRTLPSPPNAVVAMIAGRRAEA